MIHTAMCVQKDGIKDGGLAGSPSRMVCSVSTLHSQFTIFFKIGLIANNNLLKVSLATSFLVMSWSCTHTLIIISSIMKHLGFEKIILQDP